MNPSDKPACPQEPSSQAAATVEKRSKRLYVLWSVALGLLIALGLVCWLVVVPHLSAPGAGDTPLHLAARRGDAEVVKSLLEGGAAVNVINNDCRTPLHEAAEGGHLDVARMLLARGAYPDKRDRPAGRSPLHIAAARGDAKLACLLLENGADAGLRTTAGTRPPDRAGLTPADLAARAGHRDLATTLRQAAARALGRIQNPHLGIWPNGQAVEITGKIYPSKANARFFIKRDDGAGAHLRGKAMEGLKLAPGDTLRVRGTIRYVHVPAPAGYEQVIPSPDGKEPPKIRCAGAVALPQTFCYLDVSEVEALKPPGGEAEK